MCICTILHKVTLHMGVAVHMADRDPCITSVQVSQYCYPTVKMKLNKGVGSGSGNERMLGDY